MNKYIAFSMFFVGMLQGMHSKINIHNLFDESLFLPDEVIQYLLTHNVTLHPQQNQNALQYISEKQIDATRKKNISELLMLVERASQSQ